MFPGTTTKLSEGLLASATTIFPKTDVVRLTGTTAIATIRPAFGGGFSGLLILIPTGGAVATTTAGNIAAVVTMTDLRPCLFVWSKAAAKWYPGAIS